MRIGLIGGVFSPPHNGHLNMGHLALWNNDVDLVWYLPCWQHAFGKDLISFDHRVKMLKKMIKSSKYFPRMAICEDEEDIKSCYSIDIISHIVSCYKDNQFRLILGSDNYWKIKDWKNFDEIRKMVDILWVSRAGEPNLPFGQYVIGYDNSGISSTQIKKLLSSGNDISHLVCKDVIEYIRENNLY